MSGYQRRVVTEKKQLDEKRERLNAFITSAHFNTLPQVEQLALTIQWSIMTAYSDVLGNRIKRFDDSKPSDDSRPRHVLD